MLKAKSFANHIWSIAFSSFVVTVASSQVAAGAPIRAWGAGGPGQSGSPHFGQSILPVPNMGFIDIAAGWDHSLALKSDGSILAWGLNDDGQTEVPIPNSDFIAVAGGGEFSLGLKSNGTIVAWGNNDWGQLNVPTPGLDFIAIAAGGYHGLALKAGGAIVAWGINNEGQCSVPDPNSDFVAVSAHSSHSLGLKSNGSIIAWGNNDFGQSVIPTPNTDFVAIAAGRYHSLGLKSNGSIRAWGLGSSGQTTIPDPNSDFTAIAAGWASSYGLKSDGTILAWGNNDWGQIDVPMPDNGFVRLGAGAQHGLALEAPPLALPPMPAPTPHDATKSRYLAFVPDNPDTEPAFRVTRAGAPGLLVGWVDFPDGNGIARLTDTPLYRAWPEPLVFVGDCEVVPDSSYEISATTDGTDFTSALVLNTTPQPGGGRFWGDVVGTLSSGIWTPPNGVVNGFDITAILKKFQVDPAAPHVTWVDVNPQVPDKVANGSDVLQVINAFGLRPYPFAAPADCP